jgi:hypothetical protein
MALQPAQQVRDALELHLLADAANDDTPARSLLLVDVVYLEGQGGLGHSSSLDTPFHSDHDVALRHGEVDGHGDRPIIVLVYESADGRLAEQGQAFFGCKSFEFSLCHIATVIGFHEAQ